MRIALIILVFLSPLATTAQGFSNVYDVLGTESSDIAHAIEYFEDEIFVFSWDGVGSIAVNSFDKSSGNLTNQIQFDFPMSAFWYAGTSMDPDGNMYLASSNWSGQPRVVKLSPNLDIEYNIEYQLINDTIPHFFRACQVYDNKLYIVIDTFYLEDTPVNPDDEIGRYPGLLITDLNGNILEGPFWVDTLNSNDLMFHIHVTDNGVYLGGEFRTLIINGDDWDPYIIKMSHEGEVEWTVEIEDDNLGWNYPNWKAAIKEHSDGSLYVGSFMNPMFDSGNSGYASLTKVSSTGEIIWTETYGELGFRCIYNEIILAEDGIYAVGGFADYNANQIKGQLRKIDYNGESEWVRTYAHNEDNPELDIDYTFTDFKRLEDGGFVMAGYTLGEGDTNSYLVRTDELGCIVEGCETSVNDVSSDSFQVNIYPNPVSSNSSYLNLDFTSKTPFNGTVQIFNSAGELVFEEMHQFTDGNLQISLEGNLVAGVYLVSISDVKGAFYKASRFLVSN